LGYFQFLKMWLWLRINAKGKAIGIHPAQEPPTAVQAAPVWKKSKIKIGSTPLMLCSTFSQIITFPFLAPQFPVS
jgi:hypothetical protein